MSDKRIVTSEKLVSKHIIITQAQHNFIKEKSQQLHMSASCFIRLAIDRCISSTESGKEG